MRWYDRIVEFPKRFIMTDNGDGTITLEPSPGTITQAGTHVNATNMNGIEDAIERIQTLNDNYVGQSVSLDWAANKLINWQKFWSEPGFTGNLIKQIDYTWNAEKLCESEVYRFFEYDEAGVLLRTRQFTIDYTWNAEKLCAGISVVEVTS